MSEVEIFLVAPPGLEDVVRGELTRRRPDLTSKCVHGGVEVRAPIGAALGLNLILKTPTRILWRMARFRARDFPKLYQKVSALPWHELVHPSAKMEVTAASRLSRLKIKTRIEETCHEALARARKSPVDPKLPSVTLYVRLHEDECTLSLDTSGERLHKRGARLHVGQAPMRETLAAAFIELVYQVGAERFDPPQEVFDPMAGSGTFLLEAATREIPLKVTDREFAFRSLVPEADKLLEVAPVPKTLKLEGWDQDEPTLRAARDNLKRAGVDAQLQRLKLSDQTAPLPTSRGPRWVFVNPPYGERLKIEGNLRDYYAKLLVQVERVASPDVAAFLFSSSGVHGKFALPAGWRVEHKRVLTNGGLPVVAFIFGRVR